MCIKSRHSDQLDSRHCIPRDLINHLVDDSHHAAVTHPVRYDDQAYVLLAEFILRRRDSWS